MPRPLGSVPPPAVKLSQPVTDIAPVVTYKDSDEPGQIVKIAGEGATGTGASGHDLADDVEPCLAVSRAV